MKRMRLIRAVSAIEDEAERTAWVALLDTLRSDWGHGWTSVIGGYLAVLVRNLPEGGRSLSALSAVDPTERPTAVEGLRAAWRAARGGRSAGELPAKQYEYTVDYRLHSALRRLNPALTAAALPSRMPTGWSVWRNPGLTEAVAVDAGGPSPANPPHGDIHHGGGGGSTELRRLLDRCTSVVERLIVWLFASTKLPPRDVRRLRWDPATGGLCLMRKNSVRAVPVCKELRALIAEWRPSAIKSLNGYLFAHNSRVCVRVSYLTRVVGAIIGDPNEESVMAAIERIRTAPPCQ